MSAYAGFEPPESFNIADYFLFDRLREGRGERVAIRCADVRWTYAQVAQLARRYAHGLRAHGVEQEHRVIVALPDGPDFAAALFGALAMGAVGVMVNPHLSADEVAYFLAYTRARAAFVHASCAESFREAAAQGGHHLKALFALGGEVAGAVSFDPLRYSDAPMEAAVHRDDAALWLFSGGTTGRPKAVVQTHTSFANTTECYAKRALGYREDDVTVSVPKLFFGYATGSNLFFPFAVGATSVLFPERATPEELFRQIERHRPTILVNVPTMVSQMLAHDPGAKRDLSSLRFATSAGEALPVSLHERWDAAYGVDLLDGLGTAEMWHIFITNRPGRVRRGTLGTVVEGFEVLLCGDDGRDVGQGEAGALWVKGNSRAIGYWQQHAKGTKQFLGEWYVSGDLLARDADGNYTYCGRNDDMLKIKGKWFAPKEVEDCLSRHPAVGECVVVGVTAADGLVRPVAFVRATDSTGDLESLLKVYAAAQLASYKVPERFVITTEALPRTHLGKVDRGRLRRELEGA